MPHRGAFPSSPRALVTVNEKDCIRSALVKDGRVLAESSASISDTIR